MSKEKRKKLLGCIDIPGGKGEQIGAYDFDLWFGFRSCCFFFHCFVFDTIPIQAPPSHLISFVFFFVVRRMMKGCFFSSYFKYDIKYATYLLFTVFFSFFCYLKQRGETTTRRGNGNVVTSMLVWMQGEK